MTFWTFFSVILTVFLLTTLGFIVVVLLKNPTFIHDNQDAFETLFMRWIAFGLVVGAIVFTCFFYAFLGGSSHQKPETTKPVQPQDKVDDDEEENYTPVENFH